MPRNPLTILILGGTQFLGRHLVRCALDREHRITLFNRGQTNPDLFPDIEKLRGNRETDLRALEGRKWDAVIDTCGFVSENVRATAKLLAGSIGHYTFVSSISVYRDFSRPGISESAPVEQLAPGSIEREGESNTYGARKALCEQAAEEIRVHLSRRNLVKVDPWFKSSALSASSCSIHISCLQLRFVRAASASIPRMTDASVALLGFAGTVVTAGLAYLQVRRTRSAASKEKQREKVQAIYEEIWKAADGVSLLLRQPWDEASNQPGGEVLERIRGLNILISQNQLFVERRIRVLAIPHLEAAIELARRLSEPRYQELWSSWYDTRAIVPADKLPPEEKELKLLFDNFYNTRDALLEALKKPFAT